MKRKMFTYLAAATCAAGCVTDFNDGELDQFDELQQVHRRGDTPRGYFISGSGRLLVTVENNTDRDLKLTFRYQNKDGSTDDELSWRFKEWIPGGATREFSLSGSEIAGAEVVLTDADWRTFLPTSAGSGSYAGGGTAYSTATLEVSRGAHAHAWELAPPAPAPAPQRSRARQQAPLPPTPSDEFLSRPFEDDFGSRRDQSFGVPPQRRAPAFTTEIAPTSVARVGYLGVNVVRNLAPYGAFFAVDTGDTIYRSQRTLASYDGKDVFSRNAPAGTILFSNADGSITYPVRVQRAWEWNDRTERWDRRHDLSGRAPVTTPGSELFFEVLVLGQDNLNHRDLRSRR